jgi:hypothetical protein
MNAYILVDSYKSEFASYEAGQGVKERGRGSKSWNSVLRGKGHDGAVTIGPKDTIWLYGGKDAMLEALAEAKTKIGEEVGGLEWTISPREEGKTLMIASTFVTLPLKRGKKRILMICQHLKKRVAEIGEENLIADSNGDKTFTSLDHDSLVAIITALPSSKDL